MSEEKDATETTEPEESKPERKFSQEHYDRLMKGQEPWVAFFQAWEGGGDAWDAFVGDKDHNHRIILETVEAWNSDPPKPALLKGADLSLAHLEGAHLSGAHLEETDLSGARLKWAQLFGAQLEETDLFEAHMEGAGLAMANLRGAHMFECDLRTSDLRNADLEGVSGLTSGQLAGADVTSAKLPEDIKDFESLKVADEAAKNSRSLFLIMLLACVYSWLTLATTTDQALIMDTGSQPLPIIRVPVPIRGFFFAAPTFLLAAYVYFHLYLHGLWSRIAELPAVFPDGRPLDQRAYPWLLTSLVRPHFKRLREVRPLFSKAKVGLSILLAWWVVPLTIYLFWAQALAAHVWYMTLLHLALFFGSLAVGVITYRGAIATLRLEDPLLTKPWHVVRQVAKAGFGGIPGAAVLMTALSAGAIWGLSELPSMSVVFHPYADLTDAQLSTSTREFEGDPVEIVPARLSGRNLRFTTLVRANLEEAALESANLFGANLFGAHLRGADLFEAILIGADLSGPDFREADLILFLSESEGMALSAAVAPGADLSGAVLSLADLSNANLTGADLSDANLTGAILNGADLSSANFNGADLTGADLHGAIFTEADFSEADLSRAILIGADLTSDNLRGANLREADLSKADLRGVDLSEKFLFGANFTGANLRGADLRGARLRGADFTSADLTGADFSEADVGGAILSEADVTGVIADPRFWVTAARGAMCRHPDTDELTRFEAPVDGGAPEICRP